MNGYTRIGDTAIHILPSDRKDSKFMVMAYDPKQYVWRNIEIYEDTEQECIDIANIVFGQDTITDEDKDVTITVDYGAGK